ncbi:hypothetical protein LXL04_032790 [Taraxacum kok-saghyz]
MITIDSTTHNNNLLFYFIHKDSVIQKQIQRGERCEQGPFFYKLHKASKNLVPDRDVVGDGKQFVEYGGHCNVEGTWQGGRFSSYIAGLDRMLRYLVEGCGALKMIIWTIIGLKYGAPWTTWVNHGSIGWKRSQSSSRTIAARPRNAGKLTRARIPTRVALPAPDLCADYTLGHNCHFTHPFELILFALVPTLENTEDTSTPKLQNLTMLCCTVTKKNCHNLWNVERGSFPFIPLTNAVVPPVLVPKE